jgi:hypothetical protein
LLNLLLAVIGLIPMLRMKSRPPVHEGATVVPLPSRQ